jgi:hypothetical protein
MRHKIEAVDPAFSEISVAHSLHLIRAIDFLASTYKGITISEFRISVRLLSFATKF